MKDTNMPDDTITPALGITWTADKGTVFATTTSAYDDTRIYVARIDLGNTTINPDSGMKVTYWAPATTRQGRGGPIRTIRTIRQHEHGIEDLDELKQYIETLIRLGE